MHNHLPQPSKLVRRSALIMTLLFATSPALAHVDASHVATGFASGFAHPFTGLDHFLAMLAVGLWASQHRRAATWILPAMFPLMMIVGACVGVAGIQVLGIETGIATSVALLGLLISFRVQLPTLASAGIISLFAMFHGYAHGVEMPIGASALSFGVGFVLSTALIHALGMLAGLVAQKWTASRALQAGGLGIAAAGAYLIAGLF